MNWSLMQDAKKVNFPNIISNSCGSIPYFKCVKAGLGLGIIGEKDLLPYSKDKNLKAAPLSDGWASRNLVFAFRSFSHGKFFFEMFE